jgi:hypothetical protein
MELSFISHLKSDSYIQRNILIKGGMKNMENNEKNALAYLTGGIGLVILIGGVFNLYPILYGLLGALILGVTSGVIKRSWTSILGTIGFVFLLSGIFGLYTFVYGLLGAVLVWVIAGSIQKYLGENNAGKTPN